MNILVCVKRVPDTAAVISVPDGGTAIDPSGVEFKLNPYDEYAVEEALSLKEANEGEVTIISLGPDDAKSVIRTALAMGADRGVHLKVESDVDPWQTAAALAAEIKNHEYDAVFFGKQAVDNDQHQVGILTANVLGIPSVGVVTGLEVADGNATASRQIEGGIEQISVSLPAAFTAQKGLNEPRYASLKGIMAAKKKPIDEKPAELPEAALTVTALSYPPERPEGRIVGEGADAVPELVRLLKEEAKAL